MNCFRYTVAVCNATSAIQSLQQDVFANCALVEVAKTQGFCCACHQLLEMMDTSQEETWTATTSTQCFSAAALMRSGFATEVPPNFATMMDITHSYLL